jgi:hypothetical protein
MYIDIVAKGFFELFRGGSCFESVSGVIAVFGRQCNDQCDVAVSGIAYLSPFFLELRVSRKCQRHYR